MLGSAGGSACGWCVMLFRRGQHDIGQPLAVQAQHAELDPFIDQPAHAHGELVLVGQVSDQHADREHIVQRQPGADPDHRDALQAEHQLAGRIEAQGHPRQLHVLIDGVVE